MRADAMLTCKCAITGVSMQSHIMPSGHVSSLVPFLGRHSLTSLGAFIGSTRV